MFEVRVNLYDDAEIAVFHEFGGKLAAVRHARYQREAAEAQALCALQAVDDRVVGISFAPDPSPEVPVAVKEPIVVDVAAAPTAVQEATTEEATNALKAFLNAGASRRASAIKVLQDFGVQRVTDLSPEQRANFIAVLTHWKDPNGETK